MSEKRLPQPTEPYDMMLSAPEGVARRERKKRRALQKVGTEILLKDTSTSAEISFSSCVLNVPRSWRSTQNSSYIWIIYHTTMSKYEYSTSTMYA